MEFITEKNRIYAEDENGKVIAEVDFPENESGVLDINHTFVDDSLRGQGVAGKLLQAAVEEIRKQGKKAAASCSYAKVWFEKNPENKDLLK